VSRISDNSKCAVDVFCANLFTDNLRLTLLCNLVVSDDVILFSMVSYLNEYK